MNGLRKLLLSCTATMLAAFALASSAATSTKLFYAEFASLVPTGNGVTVKVTVYNGSPPPGLSTMNSLQITAPAGVTIRGISPGTISPIDGAQTVTVANFPGIKRSESKEFTLTVDNPISSCTTGTWAIAANTGNAFPGGDSFDPIVEKMKLTSGVGCDVFLACAQPLNVYNEPASPSGNLTSIERLPNKDGSACQDVGFNVSFSNGDKTVQIQWDEQAFPNVVLKATVTWPLELTETATSFPKRTAVAWELIQPPNPGAGTPNYTLAPTCTSDQPPGPSPVPHTPMPTVNYAPYTGQRVRVCLLEETFKVQTPYPTTALCPATSDPAVGCVLVDSVFFITGDPWLTRQ